MNARAFILFLLLAAPVHAQGFAGLGTQTSDFAAVTAPAGLEFPRDHLSHPEFRIEWWYLTANLTGPDGEEYGVQWTLFRQAMTPGPERDGWENTQIWMGNAGLTARSTHRFAQSFARGGVGQAGVTGAPFHAWIDDWSLASPADDLDNLRITARGTDFAYDLRATTDQPLVPQGNDGFSVKSDLGQASYYYSQPAYEIDGTIEIDGREIPVTGRGWLDREWSSQPLAEGQDGWDWFSLHLASGASVMLFGIRETERPRFVTGTWIAADGQTTALRGDQITMTPLAETRVAGRLIPTRWHLAIPDFGLAVDTEPLNAQSWMGTLFPYWEGPIMISGSENGRGYLEMTGYQ